ncbi:hypothetical protein MMC30_001196 [Trapelia coarctata]|nr:hypothetical protein [Trapelia coarctata]
MSPAKQRTSDNDDVFHASQNQPENTAEPDQPSRVERARLAPNSSSHNNLDPSVQASGPDTGHKSDPSLGGHIQTSASIASIVTQRAAKLAKISEDVGSNLRPKGQVRKTVGGGLEYFQEETGSWVPAVYHNDLRSQLIQEASSRGKYDHERKRGKGVDNVTSFLMSQKSWGNERQHWPNILFQIKTVPDLALPRNIPFWRRDGQLVLDHDNNPVRNFLTLPATCSSEMEGWLLVAICHSDHRIQIADIRARMPETKIRAGKSVPLFGSNNISMRMSRFRKEAAIGPRTERAGSRELWAAYKELLPQQCLAENSTKALNRSLTNAEKERIDNENKGKFPQKGRAEKRTVDLKHSETSKKRKFEDKKNPSGEQTSKTQVPVKRARVGLQTSDFATTTENNSTVVPGYRTVNQLATVGYGPYPNGYDQPYNPLAAGEHQGYGRQGIQPEQNGVRGYEEERLGANFRPTGQAHYDDINLHPNFPCFSRASLVTDRDGPHAVAVDTEHSIPGHSLARGRGLPQSGFTPFTETQGGNFQGVPTYSFESNFGQPRNGRAEPTQTCSWSFQVASDHVSAEEQDQNGFRAYQYPAEPLSEVESEPSYPDPEELGYGPYGPPPKGYRFAW